MSKTNIKHVLLKNFLKCVVLTPFAISFINPNILNAGLEFQWNDDGNFKKLRWYQKDNRKSARNKIFLFLRSADRKTGLLKVNIKVPDKYFSKIKEKRVSFCEVCRRFCGSPRGFP